MTKTTNRTASTDHYSELASALGCDEMDSHDGRLQTAREMRNIADENRKLRQALAFIAADKKLTVDHLRGYADGILQALDAIIEGREAGR